LCGGLWRFWYRDRQPSWPPGVEEVSIPRGDNSLQMAMFAASTAALPMPLVVDLHPWGLDYRALTSSVVMASMMRNWNYIHPEMGGPGISTDACCSRRVLDDIDRAIDFGVSKGKADAGRVYVVGASGGGYAALCAALGSRRVVAAYSVWVPVTDLEAWYVETRVRDYRFAEEILHCTGSGKTLDPMKARERSPMYMAVDASRLPRSRIMIFAGIHDGHQGPVSIAHSLRFFNRLAEISGFSGQTASEMEMDRLLNHPEAYRPTGSILGDRQVFWERQAGNLHISIFDGGHEILPETALRLLEDISFR